MPTSDFMGFLLGLWIPIISTLTLRKYFQIPIKTALIPGFFPFIVKGIIYTVI